VSDKIHIWMAIDPETRRVLAQSREFGDGDFPRGPRGAGWPRREHDIDTTDWAALLAGGMPGEEQDRMHRDWWDAAGQEGDPLWPEV
jgi:hypothetical protein